MRLARAIAVVRPQTGNSVVAGRVRHGASSAPQSNPLGSPACAQACANGGLPRPFHASFSPTASHRTGVASSPGIRPRAASSSLGHAMPDRRCCRGQVLARFNPSGSRRMRIDKRLHQHALMRNCARQRTRAMTKSIGVEFARWERSERGERTSGFQPSAQLTMPMLCLYGLRSSQQPALSVPLLPVAPLFFADVDTT
jgi:hypothetical protein